MEEKLESKSLVQLIQKDFGIEVEFDGELDFDIDRYHKWLARRIEELLDSDFNRLLNIFYRIDIQESKLKEALALTKPGSIARELAHLVIDRQKQKIITRQTGRR